MSSTTTNQSSSSRKSPEWHTYHENGTPVITGLRILNSLTHNKDIFKPISGRQIKLYACGPTVYDSSHMGHARTYLSLDILRRILSEYFRYDVKFVMNITDIDDKIIKRARQNYLFEKYERENGNNFQVIGRDVSKALEAFRLKVEIETDPDKKTMMTTMLNEVHQTAISVEKDLKEAKNLEEQCRKLIQSAKSVLSDWLDSQFGDTVTDHSIFSSLAFKYEDEYFQDMEALNVQPPNVLTRVSEFVPEIVEYIEKIIKNGYAYQTSDGSVYFDTVKFQSNEKHFYAKLVPEAVGDKENEAKNMKESEGELSLKVEGKKNPSDFALWKASKKGEPKWDSPWGEGRPGWHIECSAMSTSICGKNLDIHAGGFDLKFPHHDNEIAQSEAYFDDTPWVNYWLHCGTLRIQGSKMSKSLKNFITIKKALETYTSRQLRILFLMHNWSDVLNYSDETMKHACSFEKDTNEFFLMVKDIIRKKKASNERPLKFQKIELEVVELFDTLKKEIHEALCDSFDTRTVIEKIRNIIKIGNKYVKDTESNNSTNILLLSDMAEYMTNLLKIFGAIENSTIGFPTSTGGNVEEELMPILNAFAEFRKEVKEIAISSKNKDILEACDKVRDDTLPLLGVRLEDTDNETRIKLDDKNMLMREREKKLAAAAAKLEAKKKREEEAALKEALKRIPPEEFFKRSSDADKYSQYDDKGIPTHLADGKEVSKSARSKLMKLWEKQKTVYEKAMATINNENGVQVQ